MTITETRYAQTLAKLEKAEAEMRRAINRWQKLRDTAKRYERRLDKEVVARHSEIAGKLDIREIASPTKPDLDQRLVHLANVEALPACGVVGKRRMSAELDKVTCPRCRNTTLYKNLQAHGG